MSNCNKIGQVGIRTRPLHSVGPVAHVPSSFWHCERGCRASRISWHKTSTATWQPRATLAISTLPGREKHCFTWKVLPHKHSEQGFPRCVRTAFSVHGLNVAVPVKAFWATEAPHVFQVKIQLRLLLPKGANQSAHTPWAFP